MTHLYVIRHAQPAGYNPALIGLSPPNSGLSPLGVRQAKRLRDRLLATKEIQADRLISSPLRRAQETAEIIAPALGVPVLLDDGIQELNLGECEGLTADQVSERYGDTDWERDPFRRLAPHADSWAEFAWRACEALHRLTRDYEGQTLVMVCHGGIIGMTFRYFLHLPLLQERLPAALAHSTETGITYWRKGSAGWALMRFNDDMHLREWGPAKGSS